MTRSLRSSRLPPRSSEHASLLRVVPAKAGTHNHSRLRWREGRRTASLNTSAAAYGSRLGGRDDRLILPDGQITLRAMH